MINLDLSKIILECEAGFNIKIVKPFTKSLFNYIAEARQADGTNVFVKLCAKACDSINEINALKVMSGTGIVKLLNSNSKKGILLLEKLAPGAMLATLNNDDQATSIAAKVMQEIWRPVTDEYKFPSTKQWVKRFDTKIELPTGFAASFLDRAKQIALNLHQDVTESVLLHGDLHHFNIISAERVPWLAIDPKGVIGERAYELGALLRNPIPNIVTTMNTKKILARRVDLFAEILGFDRQRIIAWGFAQAVLSAVWSLDDSMDDWKIYLKCAENL